MHSLPKCLLFILIPLLFSCRKYTPDDYLKKIMNDEDYVKSYSDSIFYFRCIYLPEKALEIIELKKNPQRMLQMSEDEFKRDLVNYSQGNYFRVVIGLNSGANILTHNIQNNQDLGRRINYLNTVVYNDWRLYDTETGAIAKPLTVNFYNNYGMTSYIELTVVFPKSKKSKKIQVAYNDRIFGISKPIEFDFNYSQIGNDKYKILFKN